jgi:hypothetical protein
MGNLADFTDALLTEGVNKIEEQRAEIKHLRLVIEKMAEASEDGDTGAVAIMAKTALNK